MIRIRMGEYDLLESGSIICSRDADIHFYIENLEYLITFVSDDSSTPQLRVRSNTGQRLELELVNFNNPLNMGNINPFPMGRIGDKQLFIMIRVSATGEGGRTVQYSWYTRQINSEEHGAD